MIYGGVKSATGKVWAQDKLCTKACFSRIAMVPLCHKWKVLLDNGLNTWLIDQEWV